MFENFQVRVLQQAARIQGVTSFHAGSAAPLPVFDISDRRIIFDKTSTVLETGTPSDDFEHITLHDGDFGPGVKLALLKFKVTTDFWFGQSRISLSDTSLIVFDADEEIVGTDWETTGTEHSPVIELNSRKLTRDGWINE